jgi:hypothetical protein
MSAERGIDRAIVALEKAVAAWVAQPGKRRNAFARMRSAVRHGAPTVSRLLGIAKEGARGAPMVRDRDELDELLGLAARHASSVREAIEEPRNTSVVAEREGDSEGEGDGDGPERTSG